MILTSTNDKEVKSEESAACDGRHDWGLSRGEGGEQAGAEAGFVQVEVSCQRRSGRRQGRRYGS